MFRLFAAFTKNCQTEFRVEIFWPLKQSSFDKVIRKTSCYVTRQARGQLYLHVGP